MDNIGDLIGAISNGKGAKFASFIVKTKGTKEVQKVTVILGASTEVLYTKDIAELNAKLPEMTGMEKLAAESVLKSRLESLEKGIGHNSAYTCEDVYVNPMGVNGGIKVHKEDGSVHVVGLLEAKTVLVKGVYKERKSSPFVEARNAILKGLPSARFRQYRLDRVSLAKLNGEVLELEGCTD